MRATDPDDRPVARRVGLALAAALLCGAPAAGLLGGLIGGARLAGAPSLETLPGAIVVLVGSALFGAITAIAMGWFCALLWALAFELLPARPRRAHPVALGAGLGAAGMTATLALSVATRFPLDLTLWPTPWAWDLVALAAPGGAVAAIVVAGAERALRR